jgi:hypothetical protein
MLLLRRPGRFAAWALLVAVLVGCQQDRQPSTAAATTSTVVPTTTIKSPVTVKSSVTVAERAWVAGVARLRRRLDRVFFQSEVILTQAKLREYIRTGRSCAAGLARLGPPTERLEGAAATAVRACRNYERAAAVYQRAAPLVAVGAGEVGDLLQTAAEHEGNGSNGLRQAEADAKVLLA